MDVTTYDIGREAAGRPATRARILDAARDLLLRRHRSDFSVAEVARAAGVTHRTVYRYFADKDALVTAVAERPTDEEPTLAAFTSYADAPEALRSHWRFFGDRLDDLRAERLLAAGIELRRARLPSGRRMVARLLADAGVPEGPSRDDLIEVIVLLTSSGTLLELVDRHGRTVDEAADLVIDAVQRLVRTARQEGPP